MTAMRIRESWGMTYVMVFTMLFGMVPALMLCGPLWGYLIFACNFLVIYGVIWSVIGEERRGILFWIATWLAAVVGFLLGAAIVVGYRWLKPAMSPLMVVVMMMPYAAYTAVVSGAGYILAKKFDKID